MSSNNDNIIRDLNRNLYNNNKLKNNIDTQISELYKPILLSEQIDDLFSKYETLKNIIDKLKDNNKSHQYLVDQAIILTNGEVILYDPNTGNINDTITYNKLLSLYNTIYTLTGELEQYKISNDELTTLNNTLQSTIDKLTNSTTESQDNITEDGYILSNDSIFKYDKFNGDFDDWTILETESGVLDVTPTNWTRLYPNEPTVLLNQSKGLFSPFCVNLVRLSAIGSMYILSPDLYCTPGVKHRVSFWGRFGGNNYKTKISIGDLRTGGFNNEEWIYSDEDKPTEWKKYEFDITPEINYTVGGSVFRMKIHNPERKSVDIDLNPNQQIDAWVEISNISFKIATPIEDR